MSHGHLLVVVVSHPLSLPGLLLKLFPQNSCSLLIDGTGDLFVEDFFVFKGLLVSFFVFGDCVLHLDLFLHIGTHNVLLVLVLSLLHGVVFPHEFVLVSNLIRYFSFGIPLHVDDVVFHLFLLRHSFVILSLSLHHEYLIEFLSVLDSLLTVKNLVSL